MAKVGRRPKDVDPPKCACGCGEPVSWQRGRGWGKFVWGHHINLKNPNTGKHMLGDKNVMKRPEVVSKMSGSSHWRNRPENKDKVERANERKKLLFSGPNSFSWKGGVSTKGEGYTGVRVGNKYIAEHRLVVEEYLGRSLTSKEIVHHINGDLTDNRIKNLEVMTQSEHVAYHNSTRVLDRNKYKPSMRINLLM